MSHVRWAASISSALAVAAALLGCPTAGRDDGLDVALLPSEVRGDYTVFAQRCSKCHSLSRPLESGITEDMAAVDRNFAGSVQVDYHLVPTSGGNLNKGATGAPVGGTVFPGANGWYGFDGFTIEASEKLSVDVSDHLSANVKVCFGCHGFEADMAYADYRFSDELNVRVGRLSPTFGGFNLRHDVANHRLSDKPLPYDMGRMLRLRAWNLGVLPSPFPDNGVEINGTHWFGDNTQVDYAVYAVEGFRSDDPHPVDLNFTLSRTPYYVDKLSTELWNFSDADDDGHTLAVGMHAAFVAAY